MHTRDGVSQFVGLWCEEGEPPLDVSDDDLVWVAAQHVVSIGRVKGKTSVTLPNGYIQTSATPDEVRWAVDYVLARVNLAGNLAVNGVAVRSGADGEPSFTYRQRQERG
jgi:hypothetical protein